MATGALPAIPLVRPGSDGTRGVHARWPRASRSLTAGTRTGARLVFRRRQPVYSPPAPLEHSPADAMALAAVLAERGNDLQPAAIALCPVIGTVLHQLGMLPGSLLARMSGSGATGFALFADAAAARAAARALRQAQPGWWIVAAPLLR